MQHKILRTIILELTNNWGFLMNKKATLIFSFSSILTLSIFSQNSFKNNNFYDVRQRTKFNSSNISSYSPNNYISENQKYDLGEMRKDGLIGRHAFLKVFSINDIGYQVCNTFTDYYAPGAFENLTLSINKITTESISLSTTSKFCVYSTNAINVQVGIPDFLKITSENEIKSVYEFSNTLTYTASRTTEVTISYTLTDEATNLQEKNYAVGTVGHVYKISCQYYETHWLWWNNEEILTDTIQNFTAYIVKDAYIDVVYYDGTFYSK